MTLWQHHARLVVAVIGIGCAIAVYAAMKERDAPRSPAVPERIDPAALIESTGNVVQQVRGTKQDFLVKAEQQLTYEGGATKLVGVDISVSNRGERDFVIRAREAQAGEQQQELHLQGDVRLSSSDGFELSTPEAFFSEATGQLRAPGPFTFTRRSLVGSGTGMTYDRSTDVLAIVAEADIRLLDAGGGTQTQFLAGNAVFTRPAHLILLGDSVHILHNEQVADASRAAALLNDDESLLQRIELRGEAEVNGGGASIDRMRARAIDLDYAGDGQQLSHVLLEGEASVLSSETGRGAGRRDVRGRTIDLRMAEDGTLKRMTALDDVRLALPGQPDTAARTIEARRLEADGLPGGGLSAAGFEGSVVYREAKADAAARIVRARALSLSLQEDAIDSATFSGAVRFEDGELVASGATLTYAPTAGSIVISGSDTGGGPRVNDEQVSVDALRITVHIDSHDMTATGGVRTTLRPRASEPAVPTPSSTAQPGTKLPGLFEQGTAASGNADRFDYIGSGGQVVYTGNATLWQAETAVRGDRITIDRRSGDLRSAGAARSTLTLATGRSQSRSALLSYTDRDRTIRYQGDESGPVQLSGPDGDLRAGRIAVVLAATGNRVEHVEAETGVTLKLDTRTATGSHLTYRATDERYVMTGTGRTPVTIVEPCRETTGSTLTFHKSADQIVIEGNQAARTQSVRGQHCSEPRPR